MKIALICFTENGFQMEKRLVKLLEAEGHGPCPWVSGRYAMQAASLDHEISFSPVKEGGLSAWAGERFGDSDGLIFIGACGIAVRAIAPYIRDKKTDPAVLAADEKGRFVIPLLSGHLGGANELAERLAAGLAKSGIPAQAVLTTATDVNRRFAVDVFAATNHLAIASHDGIARVSARLLRDGYLTMSVAGECEGEIPPEVRLVPYPPKEPVDVLVAPQCEAGERCSLWLIPSCLLLGVGCRRGKSEEELEAFVRETLEKEKLSSMAVAGIASVDVKADEVGILALAEQLAVPFLTYPAGRLQGVDGTFTSSGFVAQQVGVDNVCERAAVCAAGEGGRLLVQKTACEGKTLAIAERKWSVKF